MLVNIACNTFCNYLITHGLAIKTAVMWHRVRQFVRASSKFTVEYDLKMLFFLQKVVKYNKTLPDSSEQ